MNKDELRTAIAEAEASNNIYERIEGTLRALVHYTLADVESPQAQAERLDEVSSKVEAIAELIGEQGDPENPDAPGAPFQIGDAVAQLISDVEEIRTFLVLDRNTFAAEASQPVTVSTDASALANQDGGLPRDLADLHGEEGF